MKSSRMSWILTVAIAATALYFSLRDVRWAEVGASVSHAVVPYLLLVFAVSSFSMFVRSVRWGVLLGAEQKLPTSTVFWATSVGYLGNAVLPARAGELLRTAMISARSNLSKSYVFATALTGLAMDVIVVVVLSSTMILSLSNTPAWLKKGSGTMAIFGLIGMAILVILPHCEPLVGRTLGLLPIPVGVRNRLLHVGEQFLLGLRAFHHVSRFALFVGISFGVWLVDGISAVWIAKALHLPLSYPVAMLLLAGLAVGSAAPSTPGYVGIYQIVAVGILPEFGMSKSDAIAYILVFQVMSYLVFIAWGLLGLWQLRRVGVRVEIPAV
jgi:glycosyltransferase 2 family protein